MSRAVLHTPSAKAPVYNAVSRLPAVLVISGPRLHKNLRKKKIYN